MESLVFFQVGGIALLLSLTAAISVYFITRKTVLKNSHYSSYEKLSKVFLWLSVLPNVAAPVLFYITFFFNVINEDSALDSPYAPFIIFPLLFSILIGGESATVGIGFGTLAVAFSAERKFRLKGKKGIGRLIGAGLSLLASIGILVLFLIFLLPEVKFYSGFYF